MSLVNINLRPVKQLLILTNTNTEWVKHAIDYASTSWGGKTFGFAIDITDSFTIAFINRLDPDFVVVFGERGQDHYNADLLDINPIEVFFENKLNTQQFHGGVNNRYLFENWNSIEILPFMGHTKIEDLHLLSRYGFAGAQLSFRISPQSDWDLSIAKEIKEILFFTRDEKESRLSVTGQPYSTPLKIFDARSNLKYYNQYSQYNHPILIIITGKQNNVQDLCLFWNVRASRGRKNILWISKDELVENIDSITTIIADRASTGSWTARMKPLVIIMSKSLPEHDIIALRDDYDTQLRSKIVSQSNFLRDNLIVEIVDPISLLPISIEIKSFTSYNIVQNDIISYTLPSPFEKIQQNDDWGSSGALFAFEISNEQYKFPTNYKLNEQELTTKNNGNTIKIFELGHYLSQAGNPLYLSIPAGLSRPISYKLPESLQFIKSYLSQFNLDFELDDKARYALGFFVLNNLEFQKIDKLIQKDIYRWILRLIPRSRDRLMTDFKSILQNQSEENIETLTDHIIEEQIYDFRSPIKTFNDLRSSYYSAINQQDQENIIGHLIGQNLFLRGIEFKCPQCSYKAWYELGSISQTYKCRGCLNTNDPKVPTQGRELKISFKANEIFVRSLEQGALLQLFAVRILEKKKGRLSWWLPGGKFTNNNQDIDFIAVISGNVIIGECKESVDQLTNNIISRVITLALTIECRTIGLCSIDSISEDRWIEIRDQYPDIEILDLSLENFEL